MTTTLSNRPLFLFEDKEGYKSFQQQVRPLLTQVRPGYLEHKSGQGGSDGRAVHLVALKPSAKRNLEERNRGTQRLFSVKYLFGEANIA